MSQPPTEPTQPPPAEHPEGCPCCLPSVITPGVAAFRRKLADRLAQRPGAVERVEGAPPSKRNSAP
jgi:hypothetical protein